MEYLAVVAVVALCVLLPWLATRIEPHVVSKDGRRFLCMGQTMTVHGEAVERLRETRVHVQSDGQLRVEQKRSLRRVTTLWRVESRAPHSPHGKAVFLLRGHDDAGLPILLALRMPATSRAVATVEALAPPASGSSPATTASTDAPAG